MIKLSEALTVLIIKALTPFLTGFILGGLSAEKTPENSLNPFKI